MIVSGESNPCMPDRVLDANMIVRGGGGGGGGGGELYRCMPEYLSNERH